MKIWLSPVNGVIPPQYFPVKFVLFQNPVCTLVLGWVKSSLHYLYGSFASSCSLKILWHKYMFALLKVSKIYSFFTVNFLKYPIFVLIGCVNTHLFCRGIFFSPADFLKCVFFCNWFCKYTIISWKIFKFHTFFAGHMFFTGYWKMKFFGCWFFEMHDLLWKYVIISSKISKIHIYTWFVFMIFFADNSLIEQFIQ